MEKPIFVALDIDDAPTAISLARDLQYSVGGFKLGPRLLMHHGAELVREIASFAPVFVDNKYFDIPNTMEAAVRATFDSGASYCTVHAQAGREALSRLANLEKKLNQKRPFKILSVTVLTSFKVDSLPPTNIKTPILDQVKQLAAISIDSGLSGVVCSPFEVETLSKAWRDCFFVTPGVRVSAIENDDQQRVMTPKQAMEKGASALVVGRPIVESKDPVQSALQIIESMKG